MKKFVLIALVLTISAVFTLAAVQVLELFPNKYL